MGSLDFFYTAFFPTSIPDLLKENSCLLPLDVSVDVSCRKKMVSCAVTV
jgi:hypothetical protein